MKIIRFIVISFLSLAWVTPRQPSKQTASTRRTVDNRCFRVPGIWLMFVFAGLAQLVEQLICNQSVIGSSPISSSRRYPLDVSKSHDTMLYTTSGGQHATQSPFSIQTPFRFLSPKVSGVLYCIACSTANQARNSETIPRRILSSPRSMDMRFYGDKFKPKLCRVAKTVATLAKHISASSTIHEKASTWQMVGNAAKLRLISFKPVSE